MRVDERVRQEPEHLDFVASGRVRVAERAQLSASKREHEKLRQQKHEIDARVYQYEGERLRFGVVLFERANYAECARNHAQKAHCRQKIRVRVVVKSRRQCFF